FQTFASTSGIEPDNVVNQQPQIDLFQNDPSRPSDEYPGKEQYGQQDGENIRKFQANEPLSNEDQERKKSENVISTGIDQLKNTTECKDLIERIPGLYRLLDLCKDDGSNGLVDKIIISKEFIKKLCDDIVPSSFKSISEINFCSPYWILRKSPFISQPSIDNSNLRPGIYLLVVISDFGIVINWPEIGCYEENASSQCKKNMTNLHRYLTKVTDHQLCLMSEEDLESFDWNLYNTDSDSDDDKGFHEYEVKKSQE
ncbi:14054_t:CDS:2, partial [Funneliformis caledonium]